jgi:oligopeptide transport system substrate-binding protein
LAHTIAYPLPQWAVKKHGQAWTESANLISNGAYELVEWEPGKRVILRRNLVYRGRFPGNVDRIECRFLTEFRPVLEAYAADMLDAVSMINVDLGTIAQTKAAYGRELVSIPRPSTFYLSFRADVPPFDDARVRQAFVHAIDRESMAWEVFQGQCLPAVGGFVPPGMPGHSSGIGLAYDPDRARDLLSQAGYRGGQGFPRVIWLHPKGPRELVVPFLQAAWRENLGLNLEAQSLEWGLLIERLLRDPAHLTLSGWSADYPDPDSLLRVLFHSGEGYNVPRWHNLRFDALVEEAMCTTDHAERMELYREADRILVVKEAVIMPLFHRRGCTLVKPWVSLPRTAPARMSLKNVVLKRVK